MKHKKPKFQTIYSIFVTVLLLLCLVFGSSHLSQVNEHSAALSAQVNSLTEQLEQSELRLSDAQSALEQAPQSQPSADSSATKTTPDSDSAVPPASSDASMVYVLPSGTKYHKSTCSYCSDKATAVTKTDAEASGYTPCSKCNP